MPRELSDFETHCDAMILALTDDAVLAEGTAARLWGLPIPTHVDLDRVVAVRPSGEWQSKRAAIHVFRRIVNESEVTSLRGRSLTTPARTFADCARIWPFVDAVALGDAALARGLMTQEEASAVIGGMHRLKGLSAARKAARHLDARSASPQESRLRAHIIAAGLPVPVPNQRILDEHGGFIAIGDLVYDEWMIVIEYDGAHHRDPLRQAKDATRRTKLRERSWYVVEITSDDLRWPERAIGKIRAALHARGVDLSAFAA